MPNKVNIEFSILSLVSSGTCKNIDDIIKFMENTFFGYTYYKKLDDVFKSTFCDSISRQIQNLLDMELLEKDNNEIKATELGKRCAEEMISPYSAHMIYQSFIQHKDKIKSLKDYKDLIESIIHLSCCTPDARLLYPPRYDQEKKELWTYWDANKDGYLCHPDDEEELLLKSIKTTQMLLRWIDCVPYSNMENFAPQGVIKNTGETLSWIVKSMARIVERPLFDFPEGFNEFLMNLSKRLKFGVREKATEIMKFNIPAIHRHRAMLLADEGYDSLESLIEVKIDELRKVKGIDDKLAIRIKKHVESYIENEIERKYQYFMRRIKELKRDENIVERLFKETDDNFSRATAELINEYFGVPCKFIGDISPHEPDCLIEINNEKIVIECKRKIGSRLVSAKESEEILGKGAKYNPIAKITVGYPDFVTDAIKNVNNTKITLITHIALTKILIKFWEEKLSKDDILNILKSGKYVSDKDVW